MTAIMTPTATADSTVLVHSYLSSAAGVGSSEPSSLVFYFCSAWHPRSVFSPTTPSRKTPRFASGRRPEATCLGRISLVGCLLACHVWNSQFDAHRGGRGWLCHACRNTQRSDGWVLSWPRCRGPSRVRELG